MSAHLLRIANGGLKNFFCSKFSDIFGRVSIYFTEIRIIRAISVQLFENYARGVCRLFPAGNMEEGSHGDLIVVLETFLFITRV